MPSHRATRPKRHHERGSIVPVVVLAVPTLIVLVGLVADGGGQVQTSANAQHIAASAARYATNEIAGEVIAGGNLTINAQAATQAAQHYITTAGLEGTAHVNGGTITVTVTDAYDTKFLNLIGINSLPAEATATAQIIDPSS